MIFYLEIRVFNINTIFWEVWVWNTISGALLTSRIHIAYLKEKKSKMYSSIPYDFLRFYYND